jgi:hypothetical protein
VGKFVGLGIIILCERYKGKILAVVRHLNVC